MGGLDRVAAEVRERLGALGRGADVEATLEEVLTLLSEASGCESAGFRWRAQADYPYYVTRGFGRDFVVIEGPLCVRDAAGLVLRHGDGTPQLACMCGAVIAGRTDASQPHFTPGGSFWTNGTTALLRDSAPGKQVTAPRNYCNAVGYESVALIPLRSGGRTYGLLQLNSREPGRFAREQIEWYEKVAQEIAEAVAARLGTAPE